MEKVGRTEFENLVFDLSMRPPILTVEVARDFGIFYRIPEANRPIFRLIHGLNAFYYYNDDDMLFGAAAPGSISNTEILFRNTLRKEMFSHLKFTKKIRQMDYLNKIVNPSKIIPLDPIATDDALKDTFIGIKKKRYMMFCDQIVHFALSMIHNLYWNDLRNLERSHYTLLECIQYVIPIVYKMEEAFSQVLDEEFDTTEIEKSAGLKVEKSTINVEKPLKVKRKKKTKKTKEEEPEKVE